MAKVIIFGVLDSAELAHWYIENDSEHDVVAFTVNKVYIKQDSFKGLPLVAFEELEKQYPPSEYKLFAPMTGRKMNRLREKVYLEGKSKGYEYISYISSKLEIMLFYGVAIILAIIVRSKIMFSLLLMLSCPEIALLILIVSLVLIQPSEIIHI